VRYWEMAIARGRYGLARIWDPSIGQGNECVAIISLQTKQVYKYFLEYVIRT
jgi:hypothetical protein